MYETYRRNNYGLGPGCIRCLTEEMQDSLLVENVNQNKCMYHVSSCMARIRPGLESKPSAHPCYRFNNNKKKTETALYMN